MGEPIVIVDSSDEEEEIRPCKKRKISDSFSSLRIVAVESLAKKQRSNDVVVIDDDDENAGAGASDVIHNNHNDGNNLSENLDEIEEIISSNTTETCNGSLDISKFNNDLTLDLEMQVDEPEPELGPEPEHQPEPKPEPEPEPNQNQNQNQNSKEHELPPKPKPKPTVNILTNEFQTFLNACSNDEGVKKHCDLIRKKIPNMVERYKNAEPNFIISKHFVRLLKRHTNLVLEKPSKTIVYFNEMYQELGANKQKNIELTEREQFHLIKLTQTLNVLNKKIRRLEEAPVEWDEGEDSSYMQLDRYRNRFCLVYKKICSLTKHNPYAGRVIFSKLDFSASKYSVINRTVDELYQKAKTFPSFEMVERKITNCVKKNRLDLSPDGLKAEINKVFLALGKLIQRRRKSELFVTLNDFLDSTSDPASSDRVLNELLNEQFKIGEDKIEALLQYFTSRQINGDENPVSPDSGDTTDSDTIEDDDCLNNCET